MPSTHNQPEITSAFATLGINPEATLDEVRQAYEDLLKVWNPERFDHDRILHAKAEVQVTQIEAAFDLILSQFSNSVETPIADIPSKPQESAESTPLPTSTSIPQNAIVIAILILATFIALTVNRQLGNEMVEALISFVLWWAILAFTCWVISLPFKRHRRTFQLIALGLAVIIGILSFVSYLTGGKTTETGQASPHATTPNASSSLSEVQSDRQISPEDRARLTQIISTCFSDPTAPSDAMRQEYWAIIDRNGGADQKEIKQNADHLMFVSSTYMGHFYEDALHSVQTNQVQKSAQREHDEQQMIADGTITQDRIQKSEELLQKIAHHEAVTTNGNSIVLDEQAIRRIISSLDATTQRVNRLFTRPQ